MADSTMPRLNIDILLCVIPHVAFAYADGRSERMLCNLALTCKDAKRLATAELYSSPYLNRLNIHKFVRAVSRSPHLAAHIRGLTFDIRPRQQLDAGWPVVEEPHLALATALRTLFTVATNIEAMAINPTEQWRLDPGRSFDTASTTTIIFRAIYDMQAADGTVHLPFKHLHITHPSMPFGENVWRSPDFAEIVRAESGSLTFRGLVDRGDLRGLPPSSGPLRLYLIDSHFSSATMTALLLKHGQQLCEFYHRASRIDTDSISIQAMLPARRLPLLRKFEVDSMLLPKLAVPVLQELHIIVTDISLPAQLLRWLTASSTPILRRIVFTLSPDFARGRYGSPPQIYLRTQEVVSKLDVLCDSRAVEMSPHIAVLLASMS